MKKKLGSRGEDLACRFLQQHGYRIMRRNYYTRYGELDIICEKNQDIIFVEVKTRRSDRYGSAEEAVTYIKQQRLRKTAWLFLQQYDKPFKGIQFDVIAVHIADSGMEINHIENAF